MPWYSSSEGHVELRINEQDAASAYHQGSCDADVHALSWQPYVRAQLDALDKAKVAHELKGFGAWSEKELADHEKNLQRTLWIACGDIVEGQGDPE